MRPAFTPGFRPGQRQAGISTRTFSSVEVPISALPEASAAKEVHIPQPKAVREADALSGVRLAAPRVGGGAGSSTSGGAASRRAKA